MIDKPCKPVCPECGSDNVLIDAWASWNVEKQAFEVATTFDNGTCEDCTRDDNDGHFRHADWYSVRSMGKYLITENGHAKMDEYGIPEQMRGAIIRYVEQSIPPGDFLQAVINNNLREAWWRADEENRTLINAYVMWFYNWAPSKCWGYPGAVEAWCLHVSEAMKEANHDDERHSSDPVG